MINTAFPEKIIKQYNLEGEQYILPLALQQQIARQNQETPTVPETRLEDVYTEELWSKIDSTPAGSLDWSQLVVLDVAAGRGFLSFHLLKKVRPKKLYLADISPAAIAESKTLLQKYYPDLEVEFLCQDVLQSELPAASFDVIIGNSFVHHFYDLPHAFQQFYRLLKSGGTFISLHEPMPMAVAIESGSWLRLFYASVRGNAYIKDFRRLKGNFSLSANLGGDVWLLTEHDTTTLLHNAGFQNIFLYANNFWRAFIATRRRLNIKDNISFSDEALMRRLNRRDQKWRHFWPKSKLSSLTIFAQKP